MTPGAISALPPGSDSVTGLTLLRDRVGAGALTPTEILIDTGRAGGVRNRNVKRAVARLTNLTFHDHEAYVTASGPGPPYVEPTGRYERVYVVGAPRVRRRGIAAARAAHSHDSHPAGALPCERTPLRRRRAGGRASTTSRARTPGSPGSSGPRSC